MSLEKLRNLSQLHWNPYLAVLLQGFVPLNPRNWILSAKENKYVLSRRLNIAMKESHLEFRDLDCKM